MLRALTKPLVFARQALRRVKDLAVAGQLRRSLEFLLRELGEAARILRRRLAGLGAREAGRGQGRRAAVGLRIRWQDALKWSRDLILACRGCAVRLCSLFQAAQAANDRTGSQVAYGLLRTLEKELWVLQSHRPAPGALANG